MSAGIMLGMLAIALTSFALTMRPRVLLLLRAKPEARFNRWGERAMSALQFAIGQWRMPRDPIAGLAHIFIFGGFMVVALATVSHFVRAFVPGFWIPGLAGQLYSLVKDIFQFLVLAGVSYALWRRLSPRPTRVGRSREGVFILCMISTIMITDFLIFGSELYAAGAGGLPWNPGGELGAWILAPLGRDGAHLAGTISYWVHVGAVLLFLNFLPRGKHFHVITSIPKVFFRNLEPQGRAKKDDLENTEIFGVRSTADLNWSMVLDVYSCTECGRCNVYCPTVLTGKPLSHRQVNLDIKHALYADAPVLLGGDDKKREELPAIVSDGRLSADTIWACTTCGSCEQECPVFIEQVPRIIEMRKQKVLMEGEVPAELARAYQGLERNQNPWGIGSDKRDAWAEGLDIPRLGDWSAAHAGEEPPLLYFIGCAGSFDDRTKKITLAMVKILRAAGVPFVILGKEEACTGDPARRTGNEYLFQQLATQNVELLGNYRVKKVLTHCPHCLHSLKTEYPQFGGSFEVVHHTQLIEELTASGKLKLTKEVKQEIAYHDSCYIGRYNGIYDAPRNSLKAVPGLKLIELPRNKSRSVCCGAGGGRFWMEEKIGERINQHRAKEALATGTSKIGSNCPFCLVMLRDGVADLGKGEEVETLDVAEIVAGAL